MHVEWCRYFDAFPSIEVPHGEAAAHQKCRAELAAWDIEAVRLDETEHEYMLLPDMVASMVYLQHGHFTQKAGKPDFFWVDKMWDKLK